MDESHTKAANLLATAINKAVETPVMVELGVGLPSDGPNRITSDDQRRVETMRITVKTPLADSRPAVLRDVLRDTLGKVPALVEAVQFESEEAHALGLRAKVENAIANGADIPANYLEWIGFSDKPERPNDHAASIKKWGGVIDIQLQALPGKDGEDAGKIVLDNINARINDIKSVLAERVAKYKGIAKDDAAGMESVKKQVNALEFEITASQFTDDEKSSPAYIRIRILTPEQKAALADPAKQRDQAAIEALGKNNILNDLNPEQLGKALGRSVLFAGDKAGEIFPKVAGREDMRRALVKSLVRLKAAKPELAQEVDALLNDDNFKPHANYGKPANERPVMKAKPFINKDPGKPGEITVDFALPIGQAAKIIAELAAMPALPELPQQAPVTETKPAVAEQITALANAQTAMGATLPPAAQTPDLATALAAAAPAARRG